MSYQEKTIWYSLPVYLLIFGWYFSVAIPVLAGPEDDHLSLVSVFIGVVVTFIIVQIILHTILAIINLREVKAGEDERDKIIELRSVRWSYYILASGVFIFGALITQAPSAMLLANVLLLIQIIAEIVGSIVQIALYRRGF